MLLTKEVEVIPNGKNIRHYKDLGYNAKRFVPLIVKATDLPHGSTVKVGVKCDICGEEKSIAYQNYWKSISNYGYYTCQSCSREKRIKTTIARYGVDHYSKTQEYKEQVKTTCNLRYGKDYPSQVPEIREQTIQTFYKNGTQKVSRQQQYICDLYQGIINYPISYYNVDICLQEDNLVVEYDGGGHLLNVVTGRETEEEHRRKEIVRDHIIKSEGYKQMRIISMTDKLPSDTILLQILALAKEYLFSTSHSWIIFDIDNSIVLNATNKNSNGVLFNYGELRRIVEKDLEKTQEQKVS